MFCDGKPILQVWYPSYSSYPTLLRYIFSLVENGDVSAMGRGISAAFWFYSIDTSATLKEDIPAYFPVKWWEKLFQSAPVFIIIHVSTSQDEEVIEMEVFEVGLGR